MNLLALAAASFSLLAVCYLSHWRMLRRRRRYYAECVANVGNTFVCRYTPNGPAVERLRDGAKRTGLI